LFHCNSASPILEDEAVANDAVVASVATGCVANDNALTAGCLPARDGATPFPLKGTFIGMESEEVKDQTT